MHSGTRNRSLCVGGDSLTLFGGLLGLVVFAGLTACEMKSPEVQVDSSVSDFDAGCSQPLSWCEDRCPQTLELAQCRVQEDCIGHGSWVTAKIGKCSDFDYVFYNDGTGGYLFFFEGTSGRLVGGQSFSDTPSIICTDASLIVSFGFVPDCTREPGIELCVSTPSDSKRRKVGKQCVNEWDASATIPIPETQPLQ